MNRFIRSDKNPHRPASSGELNQRLGLKPKEKLPDKGMPPREVDGFEVWVLEKQPGRRTHRVMAKCPVCRIIISAGRLQQHMPIHKEEAR